MTLAFPIGHFGIFCPSGRVFGDKPLGWVGNFSHSAAIIPTTFWGESPPPGLTLPRAGCGGVCVWGWGVGEGEAYEGIYCPNTEKMTFKIANNIKIKLLCSK